MKNSTDPLQKSNKVDIVEEQPGVLYLGAPGWTKAMQIMLVYGLNHRTLLSMFSAGMLTGRAEQAAQELKAAEDSEAKAMDSFAFDEPDQLSDWCNVCPGMAKGLKCDVNRNCTKIAN